MDYNAHNMIQNRWGMLLFNLRIFGARSRTVIYLHMSASSGWVTVHTGLADNLIFRTGTKLTGSNKVCLYFSKFSDLLAACICCLNSLVFAVLQSCWHCTVDSASGSVRPYYTHRWTSASLENLMHISVQFWLAQPGSH